MRTNLTELIRTLRLRTGTERDPVPDPFDTLAIQYRLSSVSAEIRALERDIRRWARGHHLIAATAAYDHLLCDAARLSCLPIPDADGPVRRVILEAELRSHGWDW